MSIAEPLVPLSEINEVVFEPTSPVLVEDLVNGSSKSFRALVRQVLIVVEENPCVVILGVEWLEIFCVVRHRNSSGLATTLHQFGITRALTELIFRLHNVVAALSEESFEDSHDVFVMQNPRPRHWAVSMGFSVDPRTSLNAASLSALRARISSM